MPRMQAATLLLSLATLSVPAVAQGTNPAVRDSFSALNYVQGQATLDGQPITTDVGTAPRRLHAGEVLATASGSADVMLAPGTLLRLGQGTTAHVVATDANRAEVRVDQGRANLDVHVVRPETLLLVDLPNGQAQILSPGLYTFNAETQTMRVLHGEADAFAGADTTANVKPVPVKGDHQVVFADAHPRPATFDREDAQSDLLPWTGPQEEQAAMASGAVNSGRGYAGAGYGGYGGYGGPYGFAEGYPYPLYSYGYGYPWGYYGDPYYGYPFGLGIGFGYWGGGYYRGYGPRIGRGYGGTGYGGHAPAGFQGGLAVGRGFAGGGGGFHGGGGRR